jgi:tRNA G10  N-methylase Trm11
MTSDSIIRTYDELDWTFLKDDTREYTHIYHDYPARMIPQIPRQLLKILSQTEGNLLFDPYCGSGSSLVEGLLAGLDVIGTDINPLARLISQSKTEYSVDPKSLYAELEKFVDYTLNPSGEPKIIKKENMDFWFKTTAKKGLGLILSYIEKIQTPQVRDFFQVAFSETVRESSNTRKTEFKLYRYNEEKLEKHNPDPFSIMTSKLFRNFKGYESFFEKMNERPYKPQSKVYSFNTIERIPEDKLSKNSVDIVVTSPPYGDSHTTVAYGQYSKLSSEWLSILEGNVDTLSMGGKGFKEDVSFNCDPLDLAVNQVKENNAKRVQEVTSFYRDLELSIKNVSQVIKPQGYSCYVVANRRVANVLLPTDQAVKCFFEKYGFTHVNTFVRAIPNKRMPSKNSPTNVAGKTEETMSKEYIVVMGK